jgi:hypothetical protein
MVQNTIPHASLRGFARLPALCYAMELTSRERDVLGALLIHKNGCDTFVWPGQARLAALCGCSVPTVQRALRRLIALGLIVRRRIRDARGRLRTNAYDLAAVFGLCPGAKDKDAGAGEAPRQTECGEASPVMDGGAAAQGANASPAMHHVCRIEADGCMLEEDTNTGAVGQAPPEPPPPEVVVDLNKAAGVSPKVGLRLLNRYREEVGEQRAEQILRDQLEALPHNLARQRTPVQSVAGYLVTAIEENWDLPPGLLLERQRAAREREQARRRQERAAARAQEEHKKAARAARMDALGPAELAALRERALAGYAARNLYVRLRLMQGKLPPEERIRAEMLRLFEDERGSGSCAALADSRAARHVGWPRSERGERERVNAPMAEGAEGGSP